MRVLKDKVSFEEVLICFAGENQGSKSLSYANEYLMAANDEFGAWTLVGLSRADILNIMLPKHTHGNPSPLIPESWLAVSAVSARVKELTRETGECWDNIQSHKNRDFSQTHIFLKWQDRVLKHVDGLHRLVAYAMFDKKDEVLAYVAGFVDHAPKGSSGLPPGGS
jgi:hypothetical protein